MQCCSVNIDTYLAWGRQQCYYHLRKTLQRVPGFQPSCADSKFSWIGQGENAFPIYTGMHKMYYGFFLIRALYVCGNSISSYYPCLLWIAPSGLWYLIFPHNARKALGDEGQNSTSFYACFICRQCFLLAMWAVV